MRNNKYGYRMLNKVIVDLYFKRCKKIILEVNKKNKGAINLYKKISFSIKGIRKRYYTNGNNAIQLEKKINYYGRMV